MTNTTETVPVTSSTAKVTQYFLKYCTNEGKLWMLILFPYADVYYSELLFFYLLACASFEFMTIRPCRTRFCGSVAVWGWGFLPLLLSHAHYSPGAHTNMPSHIAETWQNGNVKAFLILHFDLMPVSVCHPQRDALTFSRRLSLWFSTWKPGSTLFVRSDSNIM